MDDVTVVAEVLVPAVARALPGSAILLRGGYCAAASYCSAAKDRPLVSGFKRSEFPDRSVSRMVCSVSGGFGPPRSCWARCFWGWRCWNFRESLRCLMLGSV